MTMLKNDLLSRIDSTRRKLSELESKLFQRLDNNRYRLRVGWLRGYIGIWTTDSDEWGVKMIYPHTKQVMSVNWPQTLFGERKEGNVLILLSSSSITWLNAVDKWVSTVASNEPSMLIVAPVNPITYERSDEPNEVVSKVSASRGNETELRVLLISVSEPALLSTLNEAALPCLNVGILLSP